MASLHIPYDFLNKIFLSHLHTDHFGDFPAYFIGGWVAGRQHPLHIYGPSGDRPETGTKYAIEHMQKAMTWDVEGRAGRLPPDGGKVIVHEFDFKGENQPVYEENGVTIRSWPANHTIDGSVSYSLEWNGLKFVFGGDTYPNKWFTKYATDADLCIHECFITVPDMVDKFGFSVSTALEVGTQIHTAPPAFGKVMSIVKPRMAVAYHFFNDPDTAPKVLEGVRSTYDGPLTLAEDYMVWNVDKDDIKVRMIFLQRGHVAAAGSPGTTAGRSLHHQIRFRLDHRREPGREGTHRWNLRSRQQNVRHERKAQSITSSQTSFRPQLMESKWPT